MIVLAVVAGSRFRLAATMENAPVRVKVDGGAS